MSHAPVKTAVVGAGAWGRNLVRALRELGSLSVVVELDARIRSRLEEELPGVLVTASLDAALQSPVDAVVIATPAPTHAAIAAEALESGRDVFVEKPLALSVAEAERLGSLAASRGRILMVGHLLLFQPAVQWMKRAIESGEVGRLLSLHQERLNLGRVRTGESALWSLGTHDVAVALFLVGRAPARISGHGQRALGKAVEDDVHVHLDFEGGVKASLHVSWLWPEKRRRLTVIGSQAMLVYDEIAQKVTLHRKRALPDASTIDDGEQVVFQGAGDPLRLELAHFLDCVANRTEPLASAASGTATVRVLEEASAAIRSPLGATAEPDPDRKEAR